jgi:hypothetical protein
VCQGVQRRRRTARACASFTPTLPAREPAALRSSRRSRMRVHVQAIDAGARLPSRAILDRRSSIETTCAKPCPRRRRRTAGASVTLCFPTASPTRCVGAPTVMRVRARGRRIARFAPRAIRRGTRLLSCTIFGSASASRAHLGESCPRPERGPAPPSHSRRCTLAQGPLPAPHRFNRS